MRTRGLRARSDHSLGASACTVTGLVEAAAADGQPAIAVTDDGLMAGVPELFRACTAHHVQPIAGCSVKVVDPPSYDRHSVRALGDVRLLAAGAAGKRWIEA